MKGRIAFTRELHAFLITDGFSHIYDIGIRENAFVSEGEENETYILIPLKPDDKRLYYEETDMYIEEITNSDVFDMAAGVEFIDFVAELSTVVIEKYLNSARQHNL
jgi:hypothetical protein